MTDAGSSIAGGCRPENIPGALRQRPQWVAWRYEERNGKKTKVPYSAATGDCASSTDPTTWCSFDQALAAMHGGGYSGIGFVFAADDPFCGIDLDGCINDDGTIVPAARQIIDGLNSYTEVSPSGRGVKVFIAGRKPAGVGCKSKAILGFKVSEVYDRARFFTVTGAIVTGTPTTVETRQDELDALCRRLWPASSAEPHGHRSFAAPADDDLVIERARRAANGAKFESLFERGDTSAYGGDESAADEALCCLLAFYTRDSAQIARIVSRSALGAREKWRARPDYRTRTVAAALAFVGTGASSSPPRAGGTGNGSPIPGADAAPNSYPCTDLGNAERFAQHHRDSLRYCQALGAWFVWDGTRWAKDGVGSAIQLAGQTARSILGEAHRCDHRERREHLSRWAVASEHRSRLEAMVALARSQPALAVTIAQFDSDHWSLNTQSGTIDLKSGQLRPHRREDLITKMAPVYFDPGAVCPAWSRFLQQIMAGDQEMIAYLQRFFGYCLTGGIELQVFPILYGVGANGKSVFIDTIKAIMGDYACDAPPTLLMKSSRDEHPTEIADLVGRRLVIASETEDGAALRMQFVKRSTGDPTLKGRFIGRDFFEFTRTHKTVLVTNNRPRVREDSEAVWRRLHLVPFGVVIPPNERDTHLLAKLREEWPGILAWLVRGCLECARLGLKPPGAVTAATAEYREEEDAVGRFLEERCTVEPPCDSPGERPVVAWAQLLSAYHEWCASTGESALKGRTFGYALDKRGLTSGTGRIGTRTAKVRVGIALAPACGHTTEGES